MSVGISRIPILTVNDRRLVRITIAPRLRSGYSPLFRLVLIALVAAFSYQWASAQTPVPGGQQIIHEFWTFREGAPQVVESLAQTTDGYLWLGTESGLYRFDGVRFERFQSPFGDQLPATDVSSLFAPLTGGLWIGYRFGGCFSFLKNGKLIDFKFPSPTGTVQGFAQDRHGIVWAASTRGVWRFDGSKWQQNPYEWNPQLSAAQVGFDREGILWALTERKSTGFGRQLFYLLPDGTKFRKAGNNLFVEGFTWDADATVLTTHDKRPAEPGSGLELEDSLPAYPILRKNSEQTLDRANGIWFVSSYDPLFRHPAGAQIAEVISRASRSNSQVYNFDPYRYSRIVDREGSIWIGDMKGVHRFSYSSLMQPQLSNTHGWFTLAPDEEGAVWISSGTGTGESTLYHVADGKVKYQIPQRGVTNFAYRARDKTFWLAGEGGLWHMVGGRLTKIALPPALANADNAQFLQAITQDRWGRMWVAFWNRGIYRFANGVWTDYGGRRDLPKQRVYVEFTDHLDRIWFGSRNNALAVLDGDRVQTFGHGDGIRVGEITAIYGRGSEIWIGGEFGLQRFNQGRFYSINAVDKECLRGISGIVETANGDVWVNGLGGIFHLRRAEVREALKNPAYQVSGERFGRREGLPGLAPQFRPLPTAIEGTDGRLWFTVNNGVVWLDPARASNKVAPPPVTIQSVSADDRGYRFDSTIRLPARTSSVQISYAAVSLSDPESIRFRYKLRESDKDWHEAGTSTSVSYRNLAPGSYHFVVAASDTNGLWSDNAATAAFTVLPAFYQTNWFRALCAAVFLALLWGIYRLRVQQLERDEQKFREAVETMPALAFVAGPDGNRQFVNRGWVEYTGLPLEQASGSGWQAAIHPGDLKRVSKKWQTSAAKGEVLEYEARLRRGADGEYRWFQTRVAALRDKRGKVVKWCGVANDIEDRKRVEQLQADLAHTNRVSLLGEMAASISHELKQPITGAITSARACLRWLDREQPDLERARAAAGRVENDGTRAADIIDRLRSLYKKASPQRELVDVNEIVHEMAVLLRGEANRFAVSIRTGLAADLPKITADRVQLQQVLMNLMLNGIEAMKDTGGVLTVKSQLEDGGVVVSVSDIGVGLPAEEAERIFDAFFTTKPQGSGMGLAISRSIIQSHGGRLWATSNSGRGATFHFTLPTEIEAQG